MRHVMFDPFGSETTGFNLGATQQQGLESNVRQARAQDYDYNVVNPYRLAGIQRNDIRDNAALPYDVQKPAIQNQEYRTQLFSHQLPLDTNIAASTGITAPYAQDFANYAGATPYGHSAQGQTRYVVHDTNGNVHWIGDFNPATLVQQARLPMEEGANMSNAQADYYSGRGLFGNQGIGGYTRSISQAELDRARAAQIYGPPSGAYNPIDSHFGMPAQQPQQPQQQIGAPSNANLGYPQYNLPAGGYGQQPQQPTGAPQYYGQPGQGGQ